MTVTTQYSFLFKTKQRRIYHKGIPLTFTVLLKQQCPSSVALIMTPEKKRDFELFTLQTPNLPNTVNTIFMLIRPFMLISPNIARNYQTYFIILYPHARFIIHGNQRTFLQVSLLLYN